MRMPAHPKTVTAKQLALVSTLVFSQIAVISPSAIAQEANKANVQSSSSFLKLIETLRDNKTLTEAQYQALKQHATVEEKSHTDSAANNTSDDDVDSRINDDIDNNVELALETEGGVKLATYDGQYAFELSGRLMYDLTVFNEDLNAIGNGANLRRAYLGVEGKIDYDWGYELTIDFADGDADIKDAYISYLGKSDWLFKFGNAKEPFGLSELTSSKYSTFIERPMVTEFAPGRNLGVHASTYQQNWAFSASVTADAWDDETDDEGDDGWGFTTRAVYSPWHTDTQSLHLASAWSYRETNDENTVKFDTRPETKSTDIKFLNTGKIRDVSNITRLGFESAWVSGPLSLQGEYMMAELAGDQITDLSFDGWYVMASWMLTGESRDYKFKKGAFGRIKPHSSSGAWELAVRFSELDLNDHQVAGGNSQISTIGVNWYLNERIRAMLNYALVNNDRNADDDGSVLSNDNPQFTQLRLQMDF